jgi:hypothetical protein
MKIGIDFGGVLSVTDISGAEHRNSLINIPHAIESLRGLVDAGHVLYLLSFCGRTRAFETRDSIEQHSASGLFAGQYYVKRKEFKGDICKKLGIDCMIDDCADVLESIVFKNPSTRGVLFGPDGWLDIVSKIEAFVHSGNNLSKVNEVGKSISISISAHNPISVFIFIMSFTISLLS